MPSYRTVARALLRAASTLVSTLVPGGGIRRRTGDLRPALGGQTMPLTVLDPIEKLPQVFVREVLVRAAFEIIKTFLHESTDSLSTEL